MTSVVAVLIKLMTSTSTSLRQYGNKYAKALRSISNSYGVFDPCVLLGRMNNVVV